LDSKIILTKAITADTVCISYLDSKGSEHTVMLSWIYDRPFHDTLCGNKMTEKIKVFYLKALRINKFMPSNNE
jgi:hypothetical protein